AVEVPRSATNTTSTFIVCATVSSVITAAPPAGGFPAGTSLWRPSPGLNKAASGGAPPAPKPPTGFPPAPSPPPVVQFAAAVALSHPAWNLLVTLSRQAVSGGAPLAIALPKHLSRPTVFLLVWMISFALHVLCGGVPVPPSIAVTTSSTKASTFASMVPAAT